MRSQRGVALAMVLWFLAAMSLLVSGIVMQARVDVRMTQMHLLRAKAAAAGDGAILLFLADLAGGKIENSEPGLTVGGQYTVGDQRVSVEIVPTAGLIDPRAVRPEVLEALIRSASVGEAEDAQLVASNVVGLRYKFLAIEDMLQVEGITKTMLDSMRDSLVVGSARPTPGKLDWNSAPANVRAVFEGLDVDKFTTRNGAAKAAPPRRGDARRGDATRPSGVGSFRVDALVESDGKVLIRRRWVTTSKNTTGMVPWRFTRTEPVRVLARAELRGE